MAKHTTADLEERSNLTNGQLLIWTGQQLHPAAPLYNMAFRFRIPAPLDPQLFQRAFQMCVDTCDVLRTVRESSTRSLLLNEIAT